MGRAIASVLHLPGGLRQGVPGSLVLVCEERSSPRNKEDLQIAELTSIHNQKLIYI